MKMVTYHTTAKSEVKQNIDIQRSSLRSVPVMNDKSAASNMLLSHLTSYTTTPLLPMSFFLSGMLLIIIFFHLL